MTIPLKALLVDDSEEDVALLVRELRRAGYDVAYRQVYAPAELEAALAEPWQIVISDWSMPVFNGLDAFRIVRQHDADLPFIIVSGTIGEEVAVDALKAGVQDFMTKGKLARLAPTIERELRESQVRRRQRQADAELAAQRREIERSERLLREVLQSVPDGVLVFDRDQRLVLWNAEAEALLGFPAAAQGTTAWRDSFTPYRADKVTPFAPDERVVTRTLRGDAVNRETVFIRRNAAHDGRWITVSTRPLLDEAGVQGGLVVFRDVTHEKAAQEQLLISDRMASVGMLAAGVAHEINNPLAAVTANLELAVNLLDESQELGDDPLRELREMLDDSRDAADRVRQIVKDLKIFSRHEDPASGAVDVRTTLDSTLRMAWNEIRHRAQLVKDYRPTPLARGSESRLGQVFLNLIVNAAQAMPEGGAGRNTIQVTTAMDEAGRVVIEIADTGSGMSPETVQRLFTPFFTTKPQGTGTGLGLAISHRIVTQLGGSIEVDSTPGVGSTFRVRLPAANDVPAPSPSIATTAPALGRARILVVDDDVMVARVAYRILAADHEVETMNRAGEALERMRAGESYDLILCDLMMPHMTGMELFAQLQQHRPDLAHRIVFLTGGAFTERAREFLDQVPNPRVEKPFDAKELRTLVSERLMLPR